jgi:hypothetical protein
MIQTALAVGSGMVQGMVGKMLIGFRLPTNCSIKE